MARYKYIDTQPKLIPVDLAAQLLPGTFEHALNHLLDHAVDLSYFDARFRNDTTGAPAYPPALLLKVVLFAYSQGIVSSRQIARACETHVTFIALCGDQAPHFTTIARFVSTLGPDIARVFAAVLAVCDQQGLIGREMFAIDGVKLPSNASKHHVAHARISRGRPRSSKPPPPRWCSAIAPPIPRRRSPIPRRKPRAASSASNAMRRRSAIG